MGVLRLMLAMSVVVTHALPHAGPSALVGGSLAVKLFFVISGFYMALILNEKYVGPGSVSLFYRNRLLRLMPAYYVSILLPLVLALGIWLIRGRVGEGGAVGQWIHLWPMLGFGPKALYLLLNLGVLGQEYTFLGVFQNADGAFLFTDAYYDPTRTAGFSLLLNPPSWSLSMELGFYLVAPWIVRGGWVRLSLVVLGSLAIHALTVGLAGANVTFWKNHFLPGELYHFALGAMAWRGLEVCRTRMSPRDLVRLGRICWGLATALLVLFPLMSDPWRRPLCLVVFAASVPFVFAATARNAWDRFIGELSYPVYLMHMFAIMVVNYAVPLFTRRETFPDLAFLLAVSSVTLGLSFLIYRFVDLPVDRLRQRLASRLPTVPPPQPA